MLGIISALFSAPVIAVVFGGIAVPSVSAVDAVLLASSHSLWISLISGSLLVESIDKIAAGVIAWLVLRRYIRAATGSHATVSDSTTNGILNFRLSACGCTLRI